MSFLGLKIKAGNRKVNLPVDLGLSLIASPASITPQNAWEGSSGRQEQTSLSTLGVVRTGALRKVQH